MTDRLELIEKAENTSNPYKTAKRLGYEGSKKEFAELARLERSLAERENSESPSIWDNTSREDEARAFVRRVCASVIAANEKARDAKKNKRREIRRDRMPFRSELREAARLAEALRLSDARQTLEKAIRKLDRDAARRKGAAESLAAERADALSQGKKNSQRRRGKK